MRVEGREASDVKRKSDEEEGKLRERNRDLNPGEQKIRSHPQNSRGFFGCDHVHVAAFTRPERGRRITRTSAFCEKKFSAIMIVLGNDCSRQREGGVTLNVTAAPATERTHSTPSPQEATSDKKGKLKCNFVVHVRIAKNVNSNERAKKSAWGRA